jgi:predicted O-methyltransferase YrrM
MKSNTQNMQRGPMADAFDILSRHPSDINEHLPMLYFLAQQCDHVTEFGVRTGASTLAFLHGLQGRRAKLRSYDINDQFGVFKTMLEHTAVNWRFAVCSTLAISQIEPTDLLFVDTLHRYDQVRQELAIHGDAARRWIVFHDTETFGAVGDDGGEGINRAIDEWLASRPEWRIVYRTHRNNGLTVIEREAETRS